MAGDPTGTKVNLSPEQAEAKPELEQPVNQTPTRPETSAAKPDPGPPPGRRPLFRR